MPLIGYILIFGLLGGFSVMVIVALSWSMRTGGFSRMARASRMIFDNEEPEGVVTDAFPGQVLPGTIRSVAIRPVTIKPGAILPDISSHGLSGSVSSSHGSPSPVASKPSAFRGDRSGSDPSPIGRNNPSPELPSHSAISPSGNQVTPGEDGRVPGDHGPGSDKLSGPGGSR